jgi:hypothetical protein
MTSTCDFKLCDYYFFSSFRNANFFESQKIVNHQIKTIDMTAKRKQGRRQKKESKPMLFSELNYKLMGLGVLMVIIGFTAMYIENEVHGFISLYVSPIVILGGYLTVMIAILKRDGDSEEPQPSA